jgi:uncharacterized protein YecE (DUF72 family)
MTHKIRPDQWKGEAEAFRAAIEPVLSAGRLEAVLFQFPYSFHYITDNRPYLGDLLACFQGVPLAVEFRVSEWGRGYCNRAFKQPQNGGSKGRY